MNWFDSVWNTVSHGVDEAIKSARRLTPASMSKEQQFVNATAAALALMVIADGKIEEGETIQVVNFLRTLPRVIELNLERETIAFYQKYIEQLEPLIGKIEKKTALVIQKGQILGDIGQIRGSTYAQQLISIIREVTRNAEPAEGKMRDEILTALT